MKVDFQYHNGSTRRMHIRYAEPLQKMGYGTYQTRAMQAAQPSDEIQSLREQADELNIEYDGRWGSKRLKKAIREANANV